MLQIENTQILYKLQSSFINASLLGLCLTKNLSSLHQFLIYGTYVLLQLQQFWDMLTAKLVDQESHKVSIKAMRLRLEELQETNSKTQEMRITKV